ncbi:MAG TPA: serine hydrolase domain-containing protein [Stellaceae bacterium]|nr:serine hydrolase domain-containing protein [Stellaceae bacterium]
MDRWLGAALDYIPRWLEFQMRQTELPGCSVAIAQRGRILLERAFGHADLARGVPLTPGHWFRVASHSKSFTAAGIMRLREQGKLKLDDTAGRFVRDLHPIVARATIAQLLSHSAGLVRDGWDAGQWQDRRPFRSAEELRTDLKLAPVIEGNTRFKYSNHGYGLAGLVIEAITGEPYRSWIKREIVDRVGLEETEPDVPLPRGTPVARGHSSKQPLGRRAVIPGDNPTHALASATGFVSTAADLARFFNQLSPGARGSVISLASRREMIRRQWREPHSSFERYYGLGIISGTLGDWDWFGHAGGFQGYITRTATLPAQDLTVSVLTNSADGLAHPWLDGVVHILRCFAKHGAPPRKLADWRGRWWSLWGAVDLVPTGNKVFVTTPAFLNPFLDASELEVTGRDRGRIALAGGFASHGEQTRLMRAGRGRVTELWLGGAKLLPEAAVAREMAARYEKRKR